MITVLIGLGVVFLIVVMARMENMPREDDEGAGYYLDGWPGLGRDYIPGRFVVNAASLQFTPDDPKEKKIEFPISSIRQVRFLSDKEVSHKFGVSSFVRRNWAWIIKRGVSLIGLRYYFMLEAAGKDGKPMNVYFSLPRDTLLMTTFRKSLPCV